MDIPVGGHPVAMHDDRHPHFGNIRGLPIGTPVHGAKRRTGEESSSAERKCCLSILISRFTFNQSNRKKV
jgi:hypothetical protein